MARIEVLSEEVASKIAAGEVVERPASVIKELIENSLDAGATRVEIEIEAGGIERLSVKDNGEGISREDLPKTIIRHATSKIRTAEDLSSVETMGFRGEALASIASVSRLTILTQTQDGQGSKLIVESDQDLSHPKISDWSGPKGTTIIMEDLFYNVPARLNFLKKSNSEAAACLEIVQNLALAHPEVSFSVKSSGKFVFDAPAVSGHSLEECLRSRSTQVMSDVEKLIYSSEESQFGQVVALVSPPGIDRATSRNIYTYVNNRLVKDKVLRFAIQRGYHGHLLKGRQPIVVIKIQMNPSLVDVNAHPAKTEVRFQYPDETQSLVAMAIRKAIRSSTWAAPSDSPLLEGAIDSQKQTSDEASSEFISQTTSPAKQLSFTQESLNLPRSSATAFNAPKSPLSFNQNFDLATEAKPNSWSRPQSAKIRIDSFDGSAKANQDSESSFLDNRFASPVSELPPKVNTWSDAFEGKTANTVIPWGELSFIGSFAKCYLMFEFQKRFLVIDQHAFHERILFEKLSCDPRLLKTTQPLIIPEVYTLSPEEAAHLEANMSTLTKMGFDLQTWSNGTVEVRAVPAILAKTNKESLLAELAERARPDTSLELSAEISSEVLETIACHAAVRSGEELTENELQDLLSQAATVDFYHNCPHGRRVFKWFDLKEIAKWFDR
jgi:DNA mismatch repair protein MutL